MRTAVMIWVFFQSLRSFAGEPGDKLETIEFRSEFSGTKAVLPHEWEGKTEQIQGLLDHPDLWPVRSLDIGATSFYVSAIIDDPARYNKQLALLYTTIRSEVSQKEEIAARLLFRSRSSGGWRVSPFVRKGAFSKGLTGLYTQETRLVRPIAVLLEGIEESHPLVRQVSFNLIEPFRMENDVWDWLKTKQWEPEFHLREQPLIEGQLTLHNEIFLEEHGALSELTVCLPGYCFSNSPLKMGKESYAEFFESLDFSSSFIEAFLPDFSTGPIQAYRMVHTLLEGPITVEVYHGRISGRALAWHMASDRQGRVWIDRIHYPDSQVNSYGIDCEVVNTGLLSNKPLEYRRQARALKKDLEFLDFDETYVDITPLLDHLAPIVAYRKARGIYRVKPRS